MVTHIMVTRGVLVGGLVTAFGFWSSFALAHAMDPYHRDDVRRPIITAALLLFGVTFTMVVTGIISVLALAALTIIQLVILGPLP